MGVTFSTAVNAEAIPASMAEIINTYQALAGELAKDLQAWPDSGLEKSDDMYGQQWQRGKTLLVLLLHQAHHRGQMTVLMRQARLKVPGVAGPAKEDWASFGQQPPAV